MISERIIALRLWLAVRIVARGLAITRLPAQSAQPLFGYVVNFRALVKTALRSHRIYVEQVAQMRKPPPLLGKGEDMGTKENPGAYDCLGAAAPDEPTFTLVARDPHAPAAVELWALQRLEAIAQGDYPRADLDKVAEALDCADAMRAWRHEKRRGAMTQPTVAYHRAANMLRRMRSAPEPTSAA
jgi:hypothetical protein